MVGMGTLSNDLTLCRAPGRWEEAVIGALVS